MIRPLKRVFGFIKQNPGVLYSLSLLIFLPLILWWNTSFTIKSFEKNIDFTLQKKALSIENILGELVVEKISFPVELTEYIIKISEADSTIKDLKVLVFYDGQFRTIASYDRAEIGVEISDPSFTLAWHQEQNIANLTGGKEERFWRVVKPIYNDYGEKIALLSMALSLKSSDLLISETARLSYIVVFAAMLVCLFLVLQHTRLFHYLKLYKELREVDKMKDNFIRMAVHELQSPIVNIRGYIDLLREETEKVLSDKQKQDFSRVSVSAKSLSELIYDILEVARIERGALDFSLSQFSPQKIVEEVVDSAGLKASNKNLCLNYSKKEIDWFIEANPNRFREILTNLIENAIKYTMSGKIDIKEWIDEKKQMYYFSIEDTGIGISGEEQKRLFERFYRVKNNDTAGVAGTGLGLWIVKSICEQIGGTIAIESIRGVGSKFVISFSASKI